MSFGERHDRGGRVADFRVRTRIEIRSFDERPSLLECLVGTASLVLGNHRLRDEAAAGYRRLHVEH
jgi:hypothetical protein